MASDMKSKVLFIYLIYSSTFYNIVSKHLYSDNRKIMKQYVA